MGRYLAGPAPVERPVAALDTLTVARSWHGRAQTKRLGRDRAGRLKKAGFSKEDLYTFEVLPVLGVEDLAATLEGLARDRFCCVVRGTPLPGVPAPCVRRSSTAPPTLAATPRRVLAIDLDGIPQGPAEDPAFDPEDGVEHLLGLLADHADPSFADASCWWQYSSSQGFKPGKLHARLWFVLDRPVSDEELRRWADAANARAGFGLVDRGLYNPVQPHYLAAPVLDGIDDPLPRRCGFRRGLGETVEITVPEPVRPVVAATGEGLEPARGVESYLAELGGANGFHNGIYRALCSYVGSHGVEGTDPLALRERLREAVLAAPPGHRSPAEVERYASVAYLDAEIGRVLARKAAEMPRLVAGTEGPPPYWPDDELPPDQAAAALAARLAEVMDRAATGRPKVGIRAAAGLGKSTAAHAAKPAGLQAHVFCPSGRLAAEQAALAGGLVVRGRVPRADGGAGRMCEKPGVAEIIAKAGLTIFPRLCLMTLRGETSRCEHYRRCAYLAQFRLGSGATRFLSHAHLPLASGLPRRGEDLPGLPPPRLAVVEEGFALALARHVAVKVADLTGPRPHLPPGVAAKLLDVAARVIAALERGEDPATAGSAKVFKRLAVLEMTLRGADSIRPGMGTAEQKRIAERLAEPPRAALKALWAVLADGRGTRQRVVLRDGVVHVHWRARLDLPDDVALLLLDGSLDERIARRFVPDLEVSRIGARRNATVVQVHDTACSRRRLLGYEGAPEAELRRAANRLGEVRRLAEVAAACGRRKVLLVTYMAAKERLGPIPGVDVAHFGGLRGTDRYKDHDVVIIAGRQQPPVLEAERIALALFGDDDVPLRLGGELVEQVRGYRTRDGSRRWVRVWVHPDPRVQAVIEQIRERESEQAIDRLRLIHRDRPALVLVLSDVPLDLTVDRLVTWRELVPSRLEVAAARLGGVLPLVPAWLAPRFPNLWESAEAASVEIRRADLNRQTPIRIRGGEGLDLLWGFDGLKPLAYRLPGQRGRPSRALVRADHPDPLAAVLALVAPPPAPPVTAAPAPGPPPPAWTAWPTWDGTCGADSGAVKDWVRAAGGEYRDRVATLPEACRAHPEALEKMFAHIKLQAWKVEWRP